MTKKLNYLIKLGTLVLALVLALVLLLCPCSCIPRPSLKTIEFINSSKNQVTLEVKGIQLYRQQETPQPFKYNISTGGTQRYSTMKGGTPNIKYPIKITWTTGNGERIQEKEFYKIEGLRPNQTIIPERGTFVIGINKKGEPKTFFVREDISETKLHYQMLDSSGLGRQN